MRKDALFQLKELAQDLAMESQHGRPNMAMVERLFALEAELFKLTQSMRAELIDGELTDYQRALKAKILGLCTDTIAELKQEELHEWQA